jgi:membrane protein YdbS with pleckstrin-like domain
MSDEIGNKSNWVYNGVWGLLTRCLCVPREAPQLPTLDREKIISRRPSNGFLNYLKLKFWGGVAVVLLASLILPFVLALSDQSDGGWLWVLTIVETVLLIFGSLFAYLAIHLRFDTMWYVFSDRSMRLRRGIWVIRESTITFENIQNVKVTQGPLQRFFGIANIVVETAGGGGAQQEPGSGMGMHVGLIEGVAEAASIRDSIMNRVQRTKTTGLGDDSHAAAQSPSTWTRAQLDVLREIRDLAQQAAQT